MSNSIDHPTTFDPNTYMLNENTSLRQYQLKLTEILVYFDKICRENNIIYYVGGGTCIGAIRHHGSIPWDCDIDVFMHRQDYEKIAKIWNQVADTSKYRFDITDREYNMHAQTGAIKDENTTYIRDHNVNYNMDHGIPIDIVVLDGIADNPIKHFMQIIYGMLFSLFNAQRIPRQHGRVSKILARFMLTIIRSQEKRYKIWKYCEKQFSKYTNTKDVGELVTGFHNGKLRYPRKIFSEPQELMYEGHIVYGPTDPHGYLKLRYPGYESYPPIEEQKPKFSPAFIDIHTSYKKYYGIEYCINTK